MDVTTFFYHIVDERKVNFHPDDPFDQYVCYKINSPSFSDKGIGIDDRLMDETIDVCDRESVDIFQIGLIELQSALGINVV